MKNKEEIEDKLSEIKAKDNKFSDMLVSNDDVRIDIDYIKNFGVAHGTAERVLEWVLEERDKLDDLMFPKSGG